MFVIERVGVSWDKRFYSGRSYMTPEPQWGPFSDAHKFDTMGQAKRMSYRIDDEEGLCTTIESAEVFETEI